MNLISLVCLSPLFKSFERAILRLSFFIKVALVVKRETCYLQSYYFYSLCPFSYFREHHHFLVVPFGSSPLFGILVRRMSPAIHLFFLKAYYGFCFQRLAQLSFFSCSPEDMKKSDDYYNQYSIIKMGSSISRCGSVSKFNPEKQLLVSAYD